MVTFLHYIYILLIGSQRWFCIIFSPISMYVCFFLLHFQEVLYLITQILLSLQHVHFKQILHRDLKTQNILMNKDRDVVKTGDFGISKILSSKSKAVTVVGTPCYISPELCEGKPYPSVTILSTFACTSKIEATSIICL